MARNPLNRINPSANLASQASAINENFALIEGYLEAGLTREPDLAPNHMTTDLDMNNKHIYNLAEAVEASQPPPLSQVEAMLANVQGGSPGAAPTPAIQTLASASGTLTLNCSAYQYFKVVLNEDVTSMLLTNLNGSGFVTEIAMEIKQNDTGNWTLALPTSFRALGTSDTSISLAANSVTVLFAKTFDNGETWRYFMQESAEGGEGSNILTPPAGLEWTPPITVYKIEDVYSTNYDPSPFLVEGGYGVTTFYVDADTGSEANPGTAALPKASLRGVTSVGVTETSKILVKARGKFYNGVTGTAFVYAGQLQVEAWGEAECRITMETHPTNPWVWTDEGGGTWASPIPLASFGYTTVVNSTDIESSAVYPHASSLANCQATPGTVFYVAGSPNKYYVHTATGASPATGHLLIAGAGNAGESGARGYSQRVQFRNVNFVGGDAAFSITSPVGAFPRRYDFIGCKFVHARTLAAFSAYTDAEIYLYQCIAGPSKFDGFSYGADSGVTPKAIEIECIGRNNGQVSTGANQGSTLHSGSKILRVNCQYYGNADQENADVNVGTRTWMVGCSYGPERTAGRFGYYLGNDGGDVQAWLEGCTFTGITTHMHANNGATIWCNNMAEPATYTTDVSGAVKRYDGSTMPQYVPPAPSQPAIIPVNANFTVAPSPVSGWTRITKVGGTSGTLERAATTATPLIDGWVLYHRDPSENAYYLVGTSKAAGPFGSGGITGGWGPNTSGGNSSILWWLTGAYGGNYTTRVAGATYGSTRNASGYIQNFLGNTKMETPISNIDYSSGITDAAVPYVFDCMLSVIGDYIDVKL